MSKLILKYLSIVATIYLLSMAIDAITIHSIPALLVLGLVLLVVNLFIKPLILLLTLPFSMGGFLNSLLAAFIIAILQHMLRVTTKDK